MENCTQIIGICKDGVRIWSFLSGSVERFLLKDTITYKIPTSKNFIIYASKSGTMFKLDFLTRLTKSCFIGQDPSLLTISDDESIIAAYSSTQQVVVYDAKTLKLLKSYKTLQDPTQLAIETPSNTIIILTNLSVNLYSLNSPTPFLSITSSKSLISHQKSYPKLLEFSLPEA